ncbi:MAG: hypothetical protein ACK56F_06475 [bacterium]
MQRRRWPRWRQGRCPLRPLRQSPSPAGSGGPPSAGSPRRPSCSPRSAAPAAGGTWPARRCSRRWPC